MDVPGTAQLTCSITGKPLDFLLQVYAPVEDVDHAFHRAIFVFTTPAVQQVHRRGAVRAFRCQLPRDNAFYPSDPAPDGAPPSALPDDLAALAASRDRWGVCSNGLQLNAFNPNARQTPSGEMWLQRKAADLTQTGCTHLLLCVGRLSPEKGVADLKEAKCPVRMRDV